MKSLQDAVTLAQDFQSMTLCQAELVTAIHVTTKELELVRQLLEIRPGDPRRISDELEVLARLADLKRQVQQ